MVESTEETEDDGIVNELGVVAVIVDSDPE
jgi:hypothetical protein